MLNYQRVLSGKISPMFNQTLESLGCWPAGQPCSMHLTVGFPGWRDLKVTTMFFFFFKLSFENSIFFSHNPINKCRLLPSGYVNSLLLNMAIEIVDFPLNMVIFHSYVTVYQRVLLLNQSFTARWSSCKSSMKFPMSCSMALAKVKLESGSSCDPSVLFFKHPKPSSLS